MNVDPNAISDLIEAAMSADYTGVRRIGNRLAKLAAEDGRLDIARSIQATLKRRGIPLQAAGYAETLPRDANSRLPLIEEGSWPTSPLFFDDIIVIGATNHPHLLDPAIWRRFPYKLDMGLPRDEVRSAMWRHFLFEDAPAHPADPDLLAKLSDGLSGADIENLSLAARRRAIIGGGEPNVGGIILALNAEHKDSAQLGDSRSLSSDQRRQIARRLNDIDAAQGDIARIVGVSRQMVHRYLKDSDDG